MQWKLLGFFIGAFLVSSSLEEYLADFVPSNGIRMTLGLVLIAYFGWK